MFAGAMVSLKQWFNFFFPIFIPFISSFVLEFSWDFDHYT